MTTTLNVGFIPLMDIGLLVAARDEGFAADEGVDLKLVREASWTNLRDKLHVGLFDAAHMLAPAAIASSLGLGHLTVPMICPIGLHLNGNAITVSNRMHEELAAAAEGDLADPACSARALAKATEARRAKGLAPPVFAMVFTFSTHHYLLRQWISAGGLKPDIDVPLTVIPPPFMVRALESGQIDGFCVGAPWNSLAAARGIGRILHFGLDLVADCPDKMLAIPAAQAERLGPAIAGLMRALVNAARWTTEPGNLGRLARSLAAPDVLDMPGGAIERVLVGRLTMGAGAPDRIDPVYLRLDENALAPTPARFNWVFDAMVAAGHAPSEPAQRARAAEVFRPDMFARAVGAVSGGEAPLVRL
ncbi:CmpA/NrtA family ABC transporter substrate-binding protein [Terrarubrum flagellatum]|uniref:CmpA/NrtA family ABC transporter substrate-binding protein n=1 Tax=Terrirubrum flagellatum TaxID=2895980 RepID=UPI0031450BEB